MEPSPNIWKDVERGKYGPGIQLRPTTTDFEWLEKLYAAADFSIHATDWGESFGYTIAEAMSAGLPMITMSTPWGDNAQVELIRNRETGFVCRGPREMARRMIDLAADPDLRLQMGHAGRQRIHEMCHLERETDLLEDVLEAVMSGRESSQLQERRSQFLDFAKSFSALESDFSESAWVDPVGAIKRSVYSIYRRSRAFVRNVRARVPQAGNLM